MRTTLKRGMGRATTVNGNGNGRAVLPPLDHLDALVCGAGTAWFIASVPNATRVAALPGATRVYADARQQLWRVPGHACH